MKSAPFKITLCLVLLVLGAKLNAQSVMEKITKLEKAVFTISAYDENENVIATRTGFFISGDGIAIAPASIFINADSVSLTLRNGRTYRISHIISSHPMADLILFKTLNTREKGFDYIIPSQNTEKGDKEVLIFSDPKEAQSGLSFGVVTGVFQAPYLDRLVKVKADFGMRSTGAPVINSDGDLIGIASYLEKNNACQYISTHVINDTLWTHYSDAKYVEHAKLHTKLMLPAPYILRGISYYMYGEWVEAAKSFSLELKRDSTHIVPYLFRAEARRQYENRIGMQSDYQHAKKMNPEHFLISYFEALDYLSAKDENKAFISLLACTDRHPHFAPALIEIGLLAIKLNKDVLIAKTYFERAIESAPLYANGYYELARLHIQYLRDDKVAMEDITKAIYLNANLPGAYSIRGTLNIQAENYLEAINDLDKAIYVDGTDTHALFNRGLAFYNLGMKQKSCKDWDTAGQLGHYKSIKYLSRYCNKTPISRTGGR